MNLNTFNQAIQFGSRAVSNDRTACTTNHPVAYQHAERDYLSAIALYNRVLASCSSADAPNIHHRIQEYNNRLRAMQTWLASYRQSAYKHSSTPHHPSPRGVQQTTNLYDTAHTHNHHNHHNQHNRQNHNSRSRPHHRSTNHPRNHPDNFVPGSPVSSSDQQSPASREAPARLHRHSYHHVPHNPRVEQTIPASSKSPLHSTPHHLRSTPPDRLVSASSPRDPPINRTTIQQTPHNTQVPDGYTANGSLTTSSNTHSSSGATGHGPSTPTFPSTNSGSPTHPKPSITPPPQAPTTNLEVDSLMAIRNPVEGRTWNDIEGLSAAKDALREALSASTAVGDTPPSLNRSFQPGRTILLYGPTGCGKTSLVHTAADATAAYIVQISANTLCADSGAHVIRAAFSAATARAPSPTIVLLSDTEALFGPTGVGLSRVQHSFMDRMQTLDSNIVVVAISRQPWTLDEAFLSRCERRLLIPVPDQSRRAGILQRSLRGESHELAPEDLDNIAEESQGYSMRDLQNLVRDAHMEGVRVVLGATHFRAVPGSTDGETRMIPAHPDEEDAVPMRWDDTRHGEVRVPPVSALDFDVALAGVRPSVSLTTMERHEQFTRDHGQNGA